MFYSFVESDVSSIKAKDPLWIIIELCWRMWSSGFIHTYGVHFK